MKTYIFRVIHHTSNACSGFLEVKSYDEELALLIAKELTDPTTCDVKLQEVKD